MILIIDDDEAITVSLGLLLKQAGQVSTAVSSPEEALERLDRGDVNLVLQDMNFSRRTTGEEGLELLAAIKGRHPRMPVLLITAWGSIDLAVQGMKAGAADFITKPWNKQQLLQSVETALGLQASGGDRPGTAPPSRAELDSRFDLEGVIGEDRRLLEILDLVGRVSATDASVLITGESGTGKEVIAEAVHHNSPRRGGPFVKVNLGGIPSTLFESEMFGHLRGAFTDAHRDRQGRFEVANGGTILLDEVGDLDLRSQVKMLRVLQDRTYEVLGSSETKTLDVRVISATNRDLNLAVEMGQFREDLLYRLNLITIHLPGLAQRRDDIPLLARHFLDQAEGTYGRKAYLGPAAAAWLQAREWPGNIRQLKHLLERALLVTGADELLPGHFEEILAMERGEGARDGLPPVGSMTVDGMEKTMILRSIEHHRGNLTRVAESLGLSRQALYRRMEKYGIKQ
jgi:two-component system NtrC family response regulator